MRGTRMGSERTKVKQMPEPGLKSLRGNRLGIPQCLTCIVTDKTHVERWAVRGDSEPKPWLNNHNHDNA